MTVQSPHQHQTAYTGFTKRKCKFPSIKNSFGLLVTKSFPNWWSGNVAQNALETCKAHTRDGQITSWKVEQIQCFPNSIESTHLAIFLLQHYHSKLLFTGWIVTITLHFFYQYAALELHSAIFVLIVYLYKLRCQCLLIIIALYM